MEIPWCRQQDEACDIGPIPQCQGEGQQPAHAISQDRDFAAGISAYRIEGGLQRSGNVVIDRKTAFTFARSPPIQQVAPKSPGGEPTGEGAFRSQVQDIGSVYQRRDQEDRRTVVPKAAKRRVAVSPDRRRCVCGAAIGMTTVMFYTRQETIEPLQRLPLDRLAQRLGIGLRDCGSEVSCRLLKRLLPMQRGVPQERQRDARAGAVHRRECQMQC